MKLSRRRFVSLLGAGSTVVATGLVGCGGDGGNKDDVGTDGGPDGLDAVDGGVDLGHEVDSGKDLGFDGGNEVDGGTDVAGEAEAVEEVAPFCPEMPDYVDTREVKVGTESTSICPYCGCGCGLLVTAVDGKVTNTEGDPDHPINEGALCSKGQSVYQVANNERRLKKVLHRAPGAADWEEVSWEQALTGIAAKIKATRDAGFMETDAGGKTVNRTEEIGLIGGAALDNEECYALSKMARALGLVFVEHQARL